MPGRWVVVALVICAVAVASFTVGIFRRDLLWPRAEAPAPVDVRVDVRVNEASICLEAPGAFETGYRAFVEPAMGECFSSSCTARYEERADALYSPLTRSLHFNSRFVYADRSAESLGCNLDCGGAGMVLVDLPTLPDGTYGVWLGTTWLGEIRVGDSRISWPQSACLSSREAGQPAPPDPSALPGTGTEAAYPPFPTVSPLPPAPGYPADPLAP